MCSLIHIAWAPITNFQIRIGPKCENNSGQDLT
jgi:hypothetical protein